jgi:phytoene dehydrogenase-like protein
VAGLVEERFRRRLQRKTDINDLLLDGAGARPGIGVVSVTRSGMNGASLIAPPRHL